MVVSIQPKPKMGLVGGAYKIVLVDAMSFNPAEAEDGFSR